MVGNLVWGFFKRWNEIARNFHDTHLDNFYLTYLGNGSLSSFMLYTLSLSDYCFARFSCIIYERQCVEHSRFPHVGLRQSQWMPVVAVDQQKVRVSEMMFTTNVHLIISEYVFPCDLHSHLLKVLVIL